MFVWHLRIARSSMTSGFLCLCPDCGVIHEDVVVALIASFGLDTSDVCVNVSIADARLASGFESAVEQSMAE